MNSIVRRKALVFLASLALASLAAPSLSAQQPFELNPLLAPPLPNPVLYLKGIEMYEAGGKQWIRYMFGVDNSAAYPDDMFAASPALPPCGNNTSAARTWVDIYDQAGKRLNGFCALGKSANLNDIWFALEPDVLPPSWVYIELNDRKTNTKYKSNLSETIP